MTPQITNLHMHETPLEEGDEVGGMIFSNEKKAVTLGNRTFRYDQTIHGYRFGGGLLVANQSRERQQNLTVVLDDTEYRYVWDHTRDIGWRWYGIRPILEVHDAASNERYWFQFRPRGCGDGSWCRLTPLLQPPLSTRLNGQLERLYYVVGDVYSYAVVIATAAFIIFWLIGGFESR